MCSHFQQVCIEGNRKLISLLFLAHILTDLFRLCAKRRRNLSALFACPIPGFWWGSMWEIIIDIFLISLIFIFNKTQLYPIWRHADETPADNARTALLLHGRSSQSATTSTAWCPARFGRLPSTFAEGRLPEPTFAVYPLLRSRGQTVFLRFSSLLHTKMEIIMSLLEFRRKHSKKYIFQLM